LPECSDIRIRSALG